MKRLISLLIGTLCVVIGVSAQVRPNDVTMISYEQSWLDIKGTVALKNNTDKTIGEVSFRMTYMDMEGKALDYEDFVVSVEIDPGKTRKVDITAYEHNRSYHYYKTPERLGHPAFKLKYELLDYKVKDIRTAHVFTSTVGSVDNAETGLMEDETAVTGEESDQEEKTLIGFKMIDSFDQMVLLWYAIAFTIGIFFLVALAAQDRSRSVSLWIIFSIAFTPIVALLLLVILGDSQSQRRSRNNRYDEDEF